MGPYACAQQDVISISVSGRKWGLKPWAPHFRSPFPCFLCQERQRELCKYRGTVLAPVNHRQKHLTNTITKTLSSALPSCQSHSFHAVTKQKSSLCGSWSLLCQCLFRQNSIPLGTSQASLMSAVHELDGKKTLQTLKAENLITPKVSSCHYIHIKIIIYHYSLYS